MSGVKEVSLNTHTGKRWYDCVVIIDLHSFQWRNLHPCATSYRCSLSLCLFNAGNSLGLSLSGYWTCDCDPHAVVDSSGTETCPSRPALLASIVATTLPPLPGHPSKRCQFRLVRLIEKATFIFACIHFRNPQTAPWVTCSLKWAGWEASAQRGQFCLPFD